MGSNMVRSKGQRQEIQSATGWWFREGNIPTRTNFKDGTGLEFVVAFLKRKDWSKCSQKVEQKRLKSRHQIYLCPS